MEGRTRVAAGDTERDVSLGDDGSVDGEGVTIPARVIPTKYLVGDDDRTVDALVELIASGAVDVRGRAAHSGKLPIHLAAWRGGINTARVETCFEGLNGMARRPTRWIDRSSV